MKDIRGDLGTVMKTGKTCVGTRSVVSALLTANPKSVLLSVNCPNDAKERVVYYSLLSQTPCLVTEEKSAELGSICGKPFPVSAVAVMDEGESDILARFKKDAEKPAKQK